MKIFNVARVYSCGNYCDFIFTHCVLNGYLKREDYCNNQWNSDEQAFLKF